MGGLLKKFEPWVVPHYTILHTMGNLASANVFGIVPFVKATLGTMLQTMGLLQSDAMKQVFSYGEYLSIVIITNKHNLFCS